MKNGTARIGAARVVPYEAEKGVRVISFPLVPRALAEWAHEECAGHPCSNSDVEDIYAGHTLDEQHRPFYIGGHRAQQQRLCH